VMVVVGHCVGRCKVRERGFGLKSRNQAVVAQFRVHHAEWRRGTVHKGGVGVCTMWWWWWGHVLAKHEAGRGWAQNPKPSHCGSVSGAPGETATGDIV
jgi:hypothetical protein